ncbi:MAG: LysM peptidoglycan-binding domain-containing protein [Trueperaceae bacterium]
MNSPYPYLLDCVAMLHVHRHLLRFAFSAIFIVLTVSIQLAHTQTTMTVQVGDTLEGVAKRFHTTPEAILQTNGLAGRDLMPGAMLKLPAPVAYTVRSGDTLASVAQLFGTTTQDLLQANGLAGSDLMPGAILKLPAGATFTPQTYVVQAGDTLYDVAVTFHMTTDTLIAINSLEGSTIKPGQTLILTAPPVTQAAPEPLVVTVKPGDTLWGLAAANGTTITALAAANNLGDAAALRPGDSLTIPGKYASAAVADQGGAVAQTVTVGRGDTLWDIARRYNTTVTALMAANTMPNSSIEVGQTLKVIPSNELLQASAVTLQPNPTPEGTTMMWPVYGEITSYFGYRRLRIGGTNMHYGLDIDGETGDQILASVAGKVTYSGWRNGFGYLVIITNGNTEYYYAHASELFVQEGVDVVVGQHIANVGATGRVTGSHLHFEVRVDGTPVDPLPLLQQYASNP